MSVKPIALAAALCAVLALPALAEVPASAFAPASALAAQAPAPAAQPQALPQGSGAGNSTPQTTSDGVDVVEQLGQRLPGDPRFFDSFLNQLAVRDLTGNGKPVILTLVYFACPMLCNLVMQGLVKGLNESGLALGKDYQAVTVSFNPKDTPRESAVYQSGYLHNLKGAGKAAPQDWLFLTGSEKSIHALADGVGFKYRWDEESKQFAHPAVAVVLTPDGRISRYLYGVTFPPRDLRLAVVEASGGKVGTSFDRVLLECFRYDPTTRRYGLYVWGFVRGGAALVFFGLAGLLFVLWRREYRRSRAQPPGPAPRGPQGLSEKRFT
jgi:protein SCO1/2